MIPLYTPIAFESTKSRDKLPFLCECCSIKFYVTKNEIQKCVKRTKENNPRRNNLKYCSKQCAFKAKLTGKVIQCKNCKTNIYKQLKLIAKNKHHFCSSSCSATYNNTHKTKGFRRSKLEFWIEQKLKEKYPILEIHYNKTNAIKQELDIYIPSLKVAFELNGIFHYEQIYGTLSKIQNNDSKKFQKCIEAGINLCVIDTSKQKRFSPESSELYLNIIINIIDDAMKVGCMTNSAIVTQVSQT